MKKIVLITLLLMLQQLLMAQDMNLPLWPAGKVPNFQKTDDKEKKDSGETVGYSLVQTPEMSVYLVDKRTANGQAVIICPGGGYQHLSWSWEGVNIAKWLNSKGVTAIVLKYRLPNSKSNIVPNLSPLMDAQRAIRTVRFNAAKWNIKKDQIGIMGFSAGGHLASTAGTQFDAGNAMSIDSIEQMSCRPDFMILMYPVISMSKSIMHAGSKNNLIGKDADSSLAKKYSAELNVTSATPTTFIVHATDDKTVPVENSLLMFQALKDKNIPVEMHIYPKGGHGFGLALGKGYLESWTDRCLDWLRSLNK